GIEGIQRFLGRVYRFVSRNASVDARPTASRDQTLQATSLPPQARAIQRKLHQTIKRVTDDFQGRWHFNTCIAAIMEFVNELYAAEGVGRDSVAWESVAGAPSTAIPSSLLADLQRNLILLLAPFAPYLAHE